MLEFIDFLEGNSGSFLQVDVFGYRRVSFALEWMGVHALMIYIFAACNILPLIVHGFYWRQPQNNIVSFAVLQISVVLFWPLRFSDDLYFIISSA